MRSLTLAIAGLLVAAFSAPAFVLNVNTNGSVQRWNLLTPQPGVSTNVVNTNSHAVRFFLASDGYSTTNKTAELNAVRAAFAQWQAVPGTYVKFEDAGLVSPPVDINISDNTNVIFWVKTNTLVNGGLDDIHGALGVTYTSASVPSNVLMQADIVLNGSTNTGWFTDFFNAANANNFVEATALHEIGHFVGLRHTPVGGATMFFRGLNGVNTQVGLSADDISAVRFLYPTALTNYGAVQGTVTKSGNPVFGAAVYARNSAGNLACGTVTATNGTYALSALPPDTYQIRVAPLDPFVFPRLCAGPDIDLSFTNVDISFLTATNPSVVVSANATNTANLSVVNAAPAFRITRIRSAISDSFAFSYSSSPTSIRVGQSNYFTGVASATLPTSGVTLAISGDGLTLGASTFNNLSGLNFWSVPISVASNATPGLRDFTITQGTNVANAFGFLEILPATLDYNFDGLEDTFQRQYFPLFTSAQASPGTDSDGDGMTNAAEFIAGTIPTNSASFLKMQSVARTNNTATISWLSVTGKRYQIIFRTNLVTGSWINVGNVVTAAGTNAQLLDTSATNTARFYRVQIAP